MEVEPAPKCVRCGRARKWHWLGMAAKANLGVSALRRADGEGATWAWDAGWVSCVVCGGDLCPPKPFAHYSEAADPGGALYSSVPTVPLELWSRALLRVRRNSKHPAEPNHPGDYVPEEQQLASAKGDHRHEVYVCNLEDLRNPKPQGCEHRLRCYLAEWSGLQEGLEQAYAQADAIALRKFAEDETVLWVASLDCERALPSGQPSLERLAEDGSGLRAETTGAAWQVERAVAVAERLERTAGLIAGEPELLLRLGRPASTADFEDPLAVMAAAEAEAVEGRTSALAQLKRDVYARASDEAGDRLNKLQQARVSAITEARKAHDDSVVAVQQQWLEGVELTALNVQQLEEQLKHDPSNAKLGAEFEAAMARVVTLRAAGPPAVEADEIMNSAEPVLVGGHDDAALDALHESELSDSPSASVVRELLGGAVWRETWRLLGALPTVAWSFEKAVTHLESDDLSGCPRESRLPLAAHYRGTREKLELLKRPTAHESFGDQLGEQCPLPLLQEAASFLALAASLGEPQRESESADSEIAWLCEEQATRSHPDWRLIECSPRGASCPRTGARYPAFALLANRSLAQVTLVLRGSSDDEFVDLSTCPMHFGPAEGGYEFECNAPMLEAARFIVHEYGLRQVLKLFAKASYQLRLVGHSFGAGVASIMALLLADDADVEAADLRAVGYGTPACVDEKLAAKLADVVVSVVNRADPVPRISQRNVQQLSDELALDEQMATTTDALSEDIASMRRFLLASGKDTPHTPPPAFEHHVHKLAPAEAIARLAKFPKGTRVVLSRGGRDADQYCGTVRHHGETVGPGVWLGIEFDTPDFGSDGSRKTRRFFDCERDHGHFIHETELDLARLLLESVETAPLRRALQLRRELSINKAPRLCCPGAVLRLGQAPGSGACEARLVPHLDKELHVLRPFPSGGADHQLSAYSDALLGLCLRGSAQWTAPALARQSALTAGGGWSACGCCGRDPLRLSVMQSEERRAEATVLCAACGLICCLECASGGERLGLGAVALPDRRKPIPHLGSLEPRRLCRRCQFTAQHIGGQ